MPSLGIKNNNYLNLKNGNVPWDDAGGEPSKTDSKGHAIFTDPAWGVRAGILQLRSYFFKHNRRTIAEILARWAPASDTIGSLPGAPRNSPKEYSIFVAGRMKISFNLKLEIFDEDRSIGHLAQLRELFFAMAAFEIGGGFKVPLKHFTAGLELVQPGIKSDGTEDHVTNTALESSPTTETVASEWRIGGSVGRRDKGARNAKADVETVQQMLRLASMILGDPQIDPGAIDGEIIEDRKRSATVKAIEAFQSRFFTRPDGVVEVNGRTWLELVRVLIAGGGSGVAPVAPGTPKFVFPFGQLPSANWTSAPRSFGARRGGGRRAHAGCDLYFPSGTVIHAIAAGTVIRGPYPFYARTSAIEIDHGAFLARYGEVQEAAFVRKGDSVVAGQPIAKVGHLVGITVPSDMLHLELYDKSAHGPLTVPLQQSARTSSGRPFLRRKDLIDPTPKLNEWQSSLSGSMVAKRETLAASAGAIPAKGFCIHLKRVRQERRSSKPFSRTIGDYQCFWNGAAIDALKGQLVERGGPGDNTTELGNNRDLRILEGTYPLAVQDGLKYKTHSFDRQNTGKSGTPKPGLLVEETDERTAILIHPGSDYLSSVGCLNPASGLTDSNSKIDFADSRERTIAIIEAMKAKIGAKFPRSRAIPDAVMIIEGEPRGAA